MSVVEVLALLVLASVVVLFVWSRRSARSAAAGTYLGFAVSELSELARRLDGVAEQVQRERILEFAMGAAARRQRLLSIRTVGSVYRGALFSAGAVRVQLVFEGHVQAEGVASLRELVPFVPVSRSGVAPRLLGAGFDGGQVVMLFEAEGRPGVLALRLSELELV